MNEIAAKLDRLLEISRLDKSSLPNANEIENELEVIYSDIYEYIENSDIDRNYFDEKLRWAVSVTRISAGFEHDKGMSRSAARENVVGAIHFLKGRV